MVSQAEYNRQIRKLKRSEIRHQKDSLTGNLGQTIVVRKAGKTITCFGWLKRVKRVADVCLVDHLVGVVKRLKTSLPIDTGRLRRSTKQLVYARDQRSFRVWSFAPYSRYVISAPPVWRRQAHWLQNRLNACKDTVTLECIVRQSGQPVQKKKIKFKVHVKKLQPRARVYAQGNLVNEIRGTYKPANTLRRDVTAAIRKQLL